MRSSTDVPVLPGASADGLAPWSPDDLRGGVEPLAFEGGGEEVWPDLAMLREEAAPEPEPEPESPEEEVDEEELARLAAEAHAAELARLEAEEWQREIRDAYERGFEEGRQEGEIAEGARLRNAIQAAEEALDELRAGEMRWTGTIEENICALAVVVARQIVGRELALDVQPVAELVRGAIAEFPVDQPIRIRVNPADLEAISRLSADEDMLGSMTRNREARWQPDATIAPGGCVVEGRERIIDGRVDTALERVYRRLTYTHA